MLADEDVRARSIFKKAKKEIKAVIHTGKVHFFARKLMESVMILMETPHWMM